MNRGLVQLPIMIDRGSSVPIQDQLFDAIRDLIAKGVARPLMRLPPSRELSQQLSISRNTVKIAYANLASQGYLSPQGTSGTFVSARLPDSPLAEMVERPAPRPERPPAGMPDRAPRRGGGRIDFAPRGANPALAPERTWRRLLIKHLPFQARLSGQTDPAGLPALREAVANAISPLRGMSVDPAQCAIVTDDYRALDTVSRVLTHRIRRVVVEDPCDSGLHYLLRSQGIEVIPVPVDRHGLCVDALPRTGIAAVFVSPSHQQPTGVTMTRARRIALLDWASETGSHIVEWDTFGEFCHDHAPVPALFSLDTLDRVVYVNGFSSWISAGAQLCCVVLPPGLTEQFLMVKPFLNPEPNWLEQRVAADFIDSHTLFSHLRRVQQHFRQVRNTIVQTMQDRLPAPRLTGTEAGRHMLWHLPPTGIGAIAVQQRAQAAGIRILTLHDGYSGFDRQRMLYDPDLTLLLGYALMDDEGARTAIGKLAGVLDP